ncbi:MAG: metallophosphoesterase [Clostridia bacterium]|nr:metallophosphoesterase [Clostridia bacterium]
MRILVVSDTHRNESMLRRAVKAQPEAQLVLHLGDGVDDVDYVAREFYRKSFVCVAGNCDYASALPDTRTMTVEGKKIFMLHGHTKNVKFGNANAVYAAREAGADILLYGHTHEAFTDYIDGLYIMNPGSLGASYYPSYGIIDITPGGIMMNIVDAYAK